MPFWIDGWVEITTFGESERDEYSWRGVIRILPIVDVSDGVSERLFGLSKDCVTKVKKVDSLAAGRGLPIYPSDQVRKDVEEIKRHEEKYGKGEIGGYTHATWHEIKSANLDDGLLAESDWALVFDLMKRLEADYRYSDDRIRVVVWYNW